MQGESENTVQKEMTLLEGCVNHLTSNFSDNRIPSEIVNVADILTHKFASVEHEQLMLKERLKGN